MLGIVIGAVVAVAAALEVLLFRRGLLRSLGRWYFEPSAPLVIRHVPFVGIPVAMFAVMVIVMSLSVRAAMTINVALSSVVMLLLMGGLAAGVWFVLAPPEWAKPAWLKEAEASALAESLARERAEATAVAIADPARFAPLPAADAATEFDAGDEAEADEPREVDVANADEPEEGERVETDGSEEGEEPAAVEEGHGRIPAEPPVSAFADAAPAGAGSDVIAANWGAPRPEERTRETDEAPDDSSRRSRIGARGLLRSRRRDRD